ncbi:hypothetical protein RCL1_005386 [Eukaryota sp. TZLM3-RCL]
MFSSSELHLDAVADSSLETDSVCSKFFDLLNGFQSSQSDTSINRSDVETAIVILQNRVESLLPFIYHNCIDERAVFFEKQKLKLDSCIKKALLVLSEHNDIIPEENTSVDIEMEDETVSHTLVVQDSEKTEREDVEDIVEESQEEDPITTVQTPSATHLQTNLALREVGDLPSPPPKPTDVPKHPLPHPLFITPSSLSPPSSLNLNFKKQAKETVQFKIKLTPADYELLVQRREQLRRKY